MSHFTRKTSPLKTIGIAYIYVSIIGFILYGTGFYKGSSFFSWGPPIKFFEHAIETDKTFYCIHLIIFFHQIINNCVNSIVYAWIINSVQDPKTKTMEYPRWLSLIIINLFNIYSELDTILIIMGFMSQISFVITIIFANIITSTYINNRYLLDKQRKPLISQYEQMITV